MTVAGPPGMLSGVDNGPAADCGYTPSILLAMVARIVQFHDALPRAA